MGVCIDEAWHNRAARQVDLACAPTRKGAHLCIGSNCDKPIAGDRDRLGAWPARVDRDEVATVQHEVGPVLPEREKSEAAKLGHEMASGNGHARLRDLIGFLESSSAKPNDPA
jgi:hypothetical protein